MQIGLQDVGEPGKELVESSIWEWRGPTQDEGDDASAWLTTYLGKNVRLVRLLSGAPPLHPVPSTPVPSIMYEHYGSHCCSAQVTACAYCAAPTLISLPPAMNLLCDVE